MLEHFEAREHFHKDVHGHVIGWAIQQLNFSALNDVADEMVPYIDVLHLLRPGAYLMCHAFICTYILPYTSRVCLCVPPDRLTAHTGHPRYLDT